MSKKLESGVSRRSFLKGTGAGFLCTQLRGVPHDCAQGGDASPLHQSAKYTSESTVFLPQDVIRTWVGPAYWANRLQDWRLSRGRIECLAGGAEDTVRTVALLAHEIARGPMSGHLTIRAGLLEDAGGGGFCGFLIGVGNGGLDYRAAALVQKASGTGGGIMCVYETDGRVRFREHIDEQAPLLYAPYQAERLVPDQSA